MDYESTALTAELRAQMYFRLFITRYLWVGSECMKNYHPNNAFDDTDCFFLALECDHQRYVLPLLLLPYWPSTAAVTFFTNLKGRSTAVGASIAR